MQRQHTTPDHTARSDYLFDAFMTQLRRLCALLDMAASPPPQEAKANFNPAQPRVPLGHPDGGQWTKVGSGLRTSEDTATRYLTNPIGSGKRKIFERYPGKKPEFSPHHADIDENIRISSFQKYNPDWWRAAWFYYQVKNYGPWDYKRQKFIYEDFGNFNYGAVGRAAGFSEGTLLRAAGWAQDNSRPHWGQKVDAIRALMGVGGKAPFGDDPKDQYWIRQGFLYYDAWKLEQRRILEQK